ncbi:MAG TPA: copper chaperone PCu(A)C [Pantanalinema sp.]
MKRFALGAVVLSCWAAPVLAAASVSVEEPWLREAPPTARVLAGYAGFRNPSDQEDALIEVTTEVADRVEIHTMAMRGGVMRMQPIPFLALPAKGKASLEPGGAHLMIYGPKRALRDGQKVPMTFVFRRGAKVRVEVPVRKYPG